MIHHHSTKLERPAPGTTKTFIDFAADLPAPPPARPDFAPAVATIRCSSA